MQATLVEQHSASEAVLAVSLELAKTSWKVGVSDGRHNTRVKAADAPTPLARLEQVLVLVEQARERWELASAVRVVVVYEAGQEGFWIERALRARGAEALMIDPASVPVARRRRRAKTDRLDAKALVAALLGWWRGERDRFRVVHIPSVVEEDSRHWRRERKQLQKEINQHRDRLGKWLLTVGCWEAVDRGFGERLARGEFRQWDGQPLGEGLTQRLCREYERLVQAQSQLKALAGERAQRLSARQAEQAERLAQLRGIGEVGALDLTLELFWRRFDNRRQVGACTGLVPQPYNSGTLCSDQGISKQSNRRVRALLIELAWLWLRYQGDSALSRWFAARTQGAGKRARRVAIVALARRLAIALWRYLDQAVVPEGAQLKGRA